MTSRLDATFSRLKREGHAGLIPFLMGYDPDAETTSALLDGLAEGGADVIEIGMPFSDPMADGPVIQAAGLRALKAGATIRGILEVVRDFRKRHPSLPVILMGYFNPVYRYGCENFCRDAAAAGVDGVILVDLPPEEDEELRPHLDAGGLKLIRLAAPTSDERRIEKLAACAGGFLYYVSIAGITGAAALDTAALPGKLARLRRFTTLPIAVGFGIKTPEQAAQAAAAADAVVVGSALVDIAHRQGTAKAIGFIKDMAAALRA